MHTHKVIYSQVLVFFLVVVMCSCDSLDKKQPSLVEKSVDNLDDSFNVFQKQTALTEKLEVDTLEIIVVQCANGYEYAMHNYDFNPIVERELNKFKNINVKPFPLKTLMGVAYQGVFDKKYCPPIIEKVTADFLILTRFAKSYDERYSNQMKWGYELRIVNTKTLEQVNSIRSFNLADYSEIEKHIENNIEKLKTDVENLK